MAFSTVTYETAHGKIETFNTGDSLHFNEDLIVEEIRVGEDGEWVIIHYTNESSGSDGSIMIPKERIRRIGEEREIF
jgi:hypothetical protein